MVENTVIALSFLLPQNPIIDFLVCQVFKLTVFTVEISDGLIDCKKKENQIPNCNGGYV